MLDVRRLLLLREVAVRGTLAAAAEALSYSPSHVSQQLTLLAREAGAPRNVSSPFSVRVSARAPAGVVVATSRRSGYQRPR